MSKIHSNIQYFIIEIKSGKELSKSFLKEFKELLSCKHEFTGLFLRDYIKFNLGEKDFKKLLTGHPELMEYFI